MTAPASASTGAPSPAPAAPHHEPNAAVDKRAKQADGEPVHAARNGVLRQRRLLSPRRRRRRGGAPGPRLGAQPAGAHRPAGPPLQARAFAPAWIRRDPSRIPASAPSMEKPPPPLLHPRLRPRSRRAAHAPPPAGAASFKSWSTCSTRSRSTTCGGPGRVRSLDPRAREGGRLRPCRESARRRRSLRRAGRRRSNETFYGPRRRGGRG